MIQHSAFARHCSLVVRDRKATAVTEFALIAPLLLIILLGIISYGGYFWRAHSIQQAANDGARAAIAGLTSSERLSLATATINSDLTGLAELKPSLATTAVQESGDTLTIRLSYNASGDVFFSFGLVPMPNPVIVRTASIKMGGF